MLGIRKLYKLLKGNMIHNSLGVVPHSSTSNSISNPTLTDPPKKNVKRAHETRTRALITVFGMDNEGKIAKEKACKVVKSLGLVKDEGELSFDIELEAEEVLVELDKEEKKAKEELLRHAFMVFDEDINSHNISNNITAKQSPQIKANPSNQG